LYCVGRITTSGAVTTFFLPTLLGAPNAITAGPDGALWFTDYYRNNIARATVDGALTMYPVPTQNSEPLAIASGPDGAVWFAERMGYQIGRAVLVQPNAFFTGEQIASAEWNYLQFQNGNPFGYFGFVEGSASTMSATLYHADLGDEYVTEGATSGSLYMYDFTSGHWWYTSASLFPDLYDFTLNAWIYYFPNTSSPGHYTTNPRYFSNLTTGQIFTM
jgi:hypothetical protein